MQIDININSKTKEITNFWNHIHFHPTDAIEDNWGRFILDWIYEDKCANYVRIYAMLEDIVTKKDGRLKYDFSLTDKRIDYMLKKGFKLLICFNFMPMDIALDKNNVSTMARYKGKKLCFSIPKDYMEWQEVCYRFTKHLIDRYGIDTVKNWYFHCWNEPDHHFWLRNTPASNGDKDKLEEYIKLYDHFAAGVLRATDKVKIGGPSAAGNKEFIENFIRHTKEGINTVTGKKGSRIDFFSIHTYASMPKYISSGDYPDVYRMLENTKEFYKIMKKYGYEGTEIVVDEWGAATSGFIGVDKVPETIFRETAYYPAFYAKMIDVYIKAIEKDKLPIQKMMICLSGQHDLTKDFDGYRAFFTLNQFPKPIYNGFALAAKLGNEIIDYQLNDDNLGIIPTKQGENIKIMLYYIEQDFKLKLPNKKVRLNINGVSGEYEIRHYRIDEDTSNSYTAFLKLSSPNPINQLEREEIIKEGKLSLLYPQETVFLSGTYTEDIIMKQNSVSLVELIKK